MAGWLNDKYPFDGQCWPAPLSVYVMWHPKFTAGPELGRAVYRWFGGDSSDMRQVGLGIPVHFRSQPYDAELRLPGTDPPSSSVIGSAAAEAPLDGRYPQLERQRARWRDVWRKPVDLWGAEHNVFVPLVDDHMVDDPSWRRDLIELAGRHHRTREKLTPKRAASSPAAAADAPSSNVHLAPVQISGAWSRLPQTVTRIQSLNLLRWTDAHTEGDDCRIARWKERLRRLLTQALVRLLRELRNDEKEGSLLLSEVFLSHAKRDGEQGPGVAEVLRDTAAGYGQIEVFYDENDLPVAHDWKPRMLDAAAGGAGFVAVQSDHYATRHWCRQEVERARTPRPLSRNASHADHRIWWVQPAVVVVTLQQRWTRLMGDLATVPTIAWRPERRYEVLDRLFCEALIAHFQLLYARQLLSRVKLTYGSDIAADCVFLTWTPDAASLVQLYSRLHRKRDRRALFIYPGHSFLPAEERQMAAYFGDEVTFVSYEALSDALNSGMLPPVGAAEHEAGAGGSRQWPAVMLSAGDSDDLAALGYDQPDAHGRLGSLQVDAAVLRLCRELLLKRVRIVYGGQVRSGESFTQLLYDAVMSALPAGPETEAPSNDAQEQAPDPDPFTPLENYLAWPYNKQTNVRERARLSGLVRHYDVLPSDDFEELPGVHPSITQCNRANALSRMREAAAHNSQATLVLAGKCYRFAGWMPGVAEELLCATEMALRLAGALDHASAARRQTLLSTLGLEHVRVLLIASFGGVARQMARFILDPGAAAPLPQVFDFDHQRAHAGNENLRQALRADPALEERIRARYEDLRCCLRGLQAVARLPDNTPGLLGITVGDWKTFMRTDSPGWIRQRLRQQVIPALQTQMAAHEAATPHQGGGQGGA